MTADEFELAVPIQLRTSRGRLSFLSATTVFGSPADVTLEEIALEMLYPADVSTEAAVRNRSANATVRGDWAPPHASESGRGIRR